MREQGEGREEQKHKNEEYEKRKNGEARLAHKNARRDKGSGR